MISDYILRAGDVKMVVDGKGAWVTSLSDINGDILFPRRRLVDESGKTKLRGGCHVCLPQFGPARKEFNLPQHGFGREELWSLEQVSESSLRLSLISDHPDYRQLRSSITYILQEKSLTIELNLQNEGERVLRIAPAFHPYFATGNVESLQLDGEVVTLDDYRDTEYATGSRKNVQVNNRTLQLNSGSLGVWALWSDRLANYFCIEPTLGGNLFLETAPSVEERLQPHASATYEFAISW